MRRILILTFLLQLVFSQAVIADMGRVSKPLEVSSGGAKTTQAAQAEPEK